MQTRPPAEDERCPASVRDISTEGISLILNQQFASGTQLGVELTNPDADLSYTIFAKVIHVHPQTDGSWRVGCRFLRRLTDEELHSLL